MKIATTISITVERREEANKIVAFLTKFGQVKTVSHGSAEAFMYQPMERLRDPEGRTVSVKSEVYTVSRALVYLPSSDYLGFRGTLLLPVKRRRLWHGWQREKQRS